MVLNRMLNGKVMIIVLTNKFDKKDIIIWNYLLSRTKFEVEK